MDQQPNMPSEPAHSYRAFISYSRVDREVAKKLQRLLEYYVLPATLRAVSAGVTREARPLTPCFRDEDELVPGQDLPDRIRRGLESSEYLVVVCSKSSAKSEWVEKEIIDFCRLGRTKNILAVVIDGEPNAAQESEESLPRALRFKIDSEGELTGQPAEPLWIDWRESARNDRVMFLRIVAALLSLQSLDELVRRDAHARRRARIIRYSLMTAGVVLFSTIAFAWLRARDTADFQGVQQALSLSRADFADNRVDAGLQRLRPFIGGGHAELVEPVIRNVLGWAGSIKQQFGSLSRPSLLRYRGALLLLDQNGNLHDLSGVEPSRIILAQDGRRLLLIQNSKASVFDATTGARLSEFDTLGLQWDSHSYETPDGLLIVMGTFPGATNGGTNHFALTISKSGTAIAQVFLSPILALRGIAVAGSCQGLLISHNPGFELNGFETLRFSTETIEAPQAIAHDLPDAASGETTDPFGDLLQQDFPDSSLVHPHHDITSSQPFAAVTSLPNPYVTAGCVAVKSDSLVLRANGVITPLSDPVILATGTDYEPANHWLQGELPKVVEDRVASLCPENAACPVVDGRGAGVTHVQGDQPVTASMDDRYGSPPPPRGAPPSATAFDSFEGDPLVFEYYHFNSGTDLAICRRMDNQPGCYEDTVTMDERRTDGFVRSSSGRYLYWEMGGTVIDLKTLHKVMKLREITDDEVKACDFTANESQFVCASNGRLAFYQASGSDAFWTQSVTSPPVGPLQLDSGQKISGLLAIDNTAFISARSDGQVGRFDSTGTVQWQLHVAGIGPIIDVLPSPSRQFILLIGEQGLRIISRDGFVQSGPLVPPIVLANKKRLGACLDRSADKKPYVDLDDRGNLSVMCGENAGNTGNLFVHSPQSAQGSISDLQTAGVCRPGVNLSAIDALKMCTAQ
jgi:hypothetical protein